VNVIPIGSYTDLANANLSVQFHRSKLTVRHFHGANARELVCGQPRLAPMVANKFLITKNAERAQNGSRFIGQIDFSACTTQAISVNFGAFRPKMLVRAKGDHNSIFLL
jgi:hypothetical protein